MKKLFVLGAIAAMSFGSTSCKKTYTCDCYDFATGVSETKEVKSKEDTAEAACLEEAGVLTTEICVPA